MDFWKKIDFFFLKFLKFLKKILIFLCKVRLKNMKYEMDFQKKYILVDFMWFLCRFMWFLVHSRWQNARPFLCCFSNFHAPSRLIGQIMAYENLKNYQTDKKAVFGSFLHSFMAVGSARSQHMEMTFYDKILLIKMVYIDSLKVFQISKPIICQISHFGWWKLSK